MQQVCFCRLQRRLFCLEWGNALFSVLHVSPSGSGGNSRQLYFWKIRKKQAICKDPKKANLTKKNSKKATANKKASKKGKTAKPIETLGFCMCFFLMLFFCFVRLFFLMYFFCCFCCFVFSPFFSAVFLFVCPLFFPFGLLSSFSFFRCASFLTVSLLLFFACFFVFLCCFVWFKSSLLVSRIT